MKVRGKPNPDLQASIDSIFYDTVLISYLFYSLLGDDDLVIKIINHLIPLFFVTNKSNISSLEPTNTLIKSLTPGTIESVFKLTLLMSLFFPSSILNVND